MTATRTKVGILICGFCSTRNCEHCPRAIRHESGKIWRCECTRPYCGGQVMRCLDCKNETDGEIAVDWRCIDQEACELAVKKRLDANPTIQMIRELEIRVSENTATEAKVKREKAPKEPTNCIHCGEPTKGGKFLPGHDARMVAELIRKAVDDKSLTQAQARAQLTDGGASETLVAKFDKAYERNMEQATKKAEQAAAKAAAPAEAEATPKAAKSGKPGPKAVAELVNP